MAPKAILFLILLTFLAFHNSLSNGFVGDEVSFIVHNRFYAQPGHLRHLFDDKYLTRGEDVLFGNTIIFSSGSVAYRPVLSLTFFFERWLCSLAPFGYHAHNLFLHILNVISVYFVIMLLSHSQSAALFGTSLFAVHPTKAEVVSTVGYRADSLSCFFLLAAFLCFIRAERAMAVLSSRNCGGRGDLPRQSVPLLCVSLAMYFLALFTKESALVFPLLVGGYLYYMRTTADRLRRSRPFLMGIGLISCFYLYVYLCVFPNTTLSQMKIHARPLIHLQEVLQIFYFQCTEMLFPWKVKVVPGDYKLPLSSLSFVSVILGGAFYMLIMAMLIKMRKTKGPLPFFLFWFLAAFFPVSHSIPLVNPVAHRYLYVPSIGFFAALGLLIDRGIKRSPFSSGHPRLGLILKAGMVAVCLLKLNYLNTVWKNDDVLARALVKAYPEDKSGYQTMGILAFKRGNCQLSRWALEKSLALGADDPRVFCFLGYCRLDEPQVAEYYFRRAVRRYPYFHLPYKGLGEVMIRKGAFRQALIYFQKNLDLIQSPRVSDFGYLIFVHKILRQDQEAQRVYQQAEKILKAQEDLQKLQRLMLSSGRDVPEANIDD